MTAASFDQAAWLHRIGYRGSLDPTLSTLNQLVRVELPGDRFITGRAVDVEADGRLVVLDECAITHRIDTGDVVHLRPG